MGQIYSKLWYAKMDGQRMIKHTTIQQTSVGWVAANVDRQPNGYPGQIPLQKSRF